MRLWIPYYFGIISVLFLSVCGCFYGTEVVCIVSVCPSTKSTRGMDGFSRPPLRPSTCASTDSLTKLPQTTHTHQHTTISEDEYHPKSKQRHRFRENLKKKLREEQQEAAAAAPPQAQAKKGTEDGDGGEAQQAGVEGAKGKKRKRGKKNKGKTAAGGGPSSSSSSSSNNPKVKPVAVSVAAHHKTGGGQQGHKKKKTKKQGGGSVAGVSATRLAAYGL